MLIPAEFESSFAQLRHTNILQEIKPESLPKHIIKTFSPLPTVNLLVLSCCDGHQFMDITQRTKFCCEEMKRTLGMSGHSGDCFHWKTVHGGPFVLSVPELKVQTYRGEPEYTERHVLREMEEAMDMKKLNVVLLISHSVCGKMRDRFKSGAEYVGKSVLAKERVMEWFNLPSTQVISWLQVHRQGGRRMYHVDYRAIRAMAA